MVCNYTNIFISDFLHSQMQTGLVIVMIRSLLVHYAFFYDDNLVTWHIGKHKVMPRSNIELYYRALASVASELLWIKSLLDDIGFFV